MGSSFSHSHSISEGQNLAKLKEKDDRGTDHCSLSNEVVRLIKAPLESPNMESRAHTQSRACAGCGAEIGHRSYVCCFGGSWHRECIRCGVCNKQIFNEAPTHEASGSYYNISLNYFFQEIYCDSHKHDNTPICCTCQRIMEPRDANYLELDGRIQCRECLECAIMDTNECQSLYIEIQEFFEKLDLKVKPDIPLLLVERQALVDVEEEKQGQGQLPKVIGLCNSMFERPKFWRVHRIINMISKSHRPCSYRVEVVAILVLSGLPRLLTGQILAHEMMHAWLKLNGFHELLIKAGEVEESVCDALSHMWLESELSSNNNNNNNSNNNNSNNSTNNSNNNNNNNNNNNSCSNKGGSKSELSEFEWKLGQLFKHKIECHASSCRKAKTLKILKIVNEHGVRKTLDHIKLTGAYSD